jgi:lipopolysaccharide/colanic/teichoic acid biosynthesis glycosyltransferase
MQNETLQNVPKDEARTYLRIATVSSKSALCFFYIGTDNSLIQLLADSFKLGLTATGFEAAKKIFKSEEGKVIDCIIIDLPYNEKELKGFYFFLKNRGFENIPIIYNDRYVTHEAVLRQDKIIDDVINLSDWQFDFYTKINFLKKSKEYILNTKKSEVQVEPHYSIAKRILDLVLSALLIILLLPVFIIIAIAIKLESKGPIFYNANRAGRGFRIFKFYKFRTMEANADKKINTLAHLNQYNQTELPRFFKISNDPRITKVGRFLRNTSLDELPQLFNVLKGDMSLVGNRPLPLYEAATLTTNESVERFMAPAGITGLWQIKKRGKAEMSAEERIELDLSYARKGNLMYDFWIIAKTPQALFQKSDV